MSNLECKECEGEVLEVVVVEEWVKIKIPIPIGVKYQYRVDKKLHESHKADLTLEEILAAAGKTSEGFRLYEHRLGHQPKEVIPGEKVDLRGCGVERFSTMPKDTTEGRGRAREFTLPSEDVAYLDSRGLDWDALRFNGSNYLVIRGWKLPVGYTADVVDISVLISPSYPEAQLDMFNVNPPVARVDGKAIGGLTIQQLNGVEWQQWSRHRTAQNPWQIGVDDLASHLSLVAGELSSELMKR